jgi:hypothetical protein
MNPMTSESVVFMTILTPPSHRQNKHEGLERISLLLRGKPQAAPGYINELLMQSIENTSL